MLTRVVWPGSCSRLSADPKRDRYDPGLFDARMDLLRLSLLGESAPSTRPADGSQPLASHHQP